jgi:hypothetical protein
VTLKITIIYFFKKIFLTQEIESWSNFNLFRPKLSQNPSKIEEVRSFFTSPKLDICGATKNVFVVFEI